MDQKLNYKTPNYTRCMQQFHGSYGKHRDHVGSRAASSEHHVCHNDAERGARHRGDHRGPKPYEDCNSEATKTWVCQPWSSRQASL